MLDPKRNRAKTALAIRHFRVVSPLLLSGYLHLLVCSMASPLSCLLLLLAPMGVVERIVDLSGYPQAVQEHRRAFSPRPPPLASLRSCLPERLSSLRGVLDPSPSRRDPGCSERCLPEASSASRHLPWRCASEDLYLPTGRWQAQAPGMLLRSGSFRSGRDPPR